MTTPFSNCEQTDNILTNRSVWLSNGGKVWGKNARGTNNNSGVLESALSQMSPRDIHFTLELKTTGIKTCNINVHKFAIFLVWNELFLILNKSLNIINGVIGNLESYHGVSQSHKQIQAFD